jgi:electron transfer flavoprotein alpha subunit
MTALVIAEHDNISLRGSTYNTVTAAVQCDNPVHVLVAGYNCGLAVEAACQIRGVSVVFAIDAPQCADFLPENIAEQILTIASNYSHILAPATTYGKSVLPRVAARLDVAQISEIIKVISPDTFDRPIYAGNVIAMVKSTDPIKVITVRSTSFAPAASDGCASVETTAAADDFDKSYFVSRKPVTSKRPELTGAKVIVACGRGVSTASNLNILQLLADSLDAAIGGSSAAVDAGLISSELQIGQGGQVVAPQLYIAIGISGAIQHLAGIKDSKIIVAINKDAEAPIFTVADYGIVADLFHIVPLLTSSIKQARQIKKWK